jgi:hypothetical protein
VAVEPSAGTDLNAASFQLRRSGPLDDALVVAYELGGTAANGIDYEALPELAVIPAGARSVALSVRPLADNALEGVETVVLRLAEPPPPSPEIRVINPYRVGRPGRAAAAIGDEPWLPTSDRPRCWLLPDGMLHLCFLVEPGRRYRLEATRDFHVWETLCDYASDDGLWHYVDANMETDSRRFYRLIPEAETPGTE